MSGLVDLFEALLPPSESPGAGARYSTAHVSGREGYRVGKDAQSTPAVLISASGRSDLTSPSIVLENLAVHHDLACSVYEPGGLSEKSCFTIIHCTSTDTTLHAHFLNLADTLILSLGASPARAAISNAINDLVELFQALSAPPRKTVQGLWAELFLISKARDPVRLARSWHAVPEEVYDFSEGCQRVEVKSTTGNLRQHHFSLGQVRPGAELKVLIASLFVQRSEAGASIADLLDSINQSTGQDPSLCFHIEKVVSLTLGSSWRRAAEDRFDIKAANNSLMFFWAEDVPAVSEDQPGKVSDVRFRSDLSGITAVPPILLRKTQGLFGAVIPR
jgi:hypothetical protein